MGKASSAKKVARAARAGGRTSAGPKRQLAFPIAIAAIVVVGALLVVFARSSNQEVAAESPKVGEHWHAAYGIDVCGNFLPNLTDVGPDTTGLHTHGDGIAHIHPFANGSAGPNATLSTFGQMVGMTFGSDSFTVNGTTYADGYDCNGQPAKVAVYVWPADDANAEPRIITKDIGSFRFDQDRLAVTLAVVPEGTDVPRPPTVPELDQLSDVPGATSSTVPGAVPPSTVAGAPTASTPSSAVPATPSTATGATPPTTVGP